MDWIDLAYDTEQLGYLVNTIINVQIPLTPYLKSTR
jgi:hypothetical protein